MSESYEETQLRMSACEALQESSFLYMHSISSLETPAATRLRMMNLVSKRGEKTREEPRESPSSLPASSSSSSSSSRPTQPAKTLTKNVK